MVLIALIIVKNGFDRKKITEANIIVSAKVLESPSDCDNLGRRGGFYKIEYNGKIFVKRGNRLVCEKIYNRKNIDVLTNRERDKIVLFDEYENSGDFLYGTLLAIIGLFIIYKGR